MLREEGSKHLLRASITCGLGGPLSGLGSLTFEVASRMNADFYVFG